jgi:MFS superfamily sulfate permease-like transporter
MKYLIFILLNLCLILGYFLGLVGSAEDIFYPVTIQVIALSISTFGFCCFFKQTKNKFFKLYLLVVIFAGVLFILEGLSRLFFKFNLFRLLY